MALFPNFKQNTVHLLNSPGCVLRACPKCLWRPCGSVLSPRYSAVLSGLCSAKPCCPHVLLARLHLLPAPPSWSVPSNRKRRHVHLLPAPPSLSAPSNRKCRHLHLLPAPPSGPGPSNRKHVFQLPASITTSHTTALDQVTSITEQESICLQTSMTMCKLLLLLFLSYLFCVMESDSFLESLYSRCQNLLKEIHNCPTWSQMLGDKRRRQFPELQVVSSKLEGRLISRTELENNGDWQTSSIKGQEVKYFSHCGMCVFLGFFATPQLCHSINAATDHKRAWLCSNKTVVH